MKKTIAILLFVCMIFTTCYAKPEIAYNNETRELFLSGNSSHKDADVSLRVFKKSESATPSDFASLIFFYQLETDKNGDYLGQFTLPESATAGDYYVYVSDDEEYGEFYLAVPSEIAACIESFATADESTIEAALNLYGKVKNVLGVSLSGDYSKYPKWTQKAMVQFIKENEPSNLTDIIDYFNKSNEAAFLVAGDKEHVIKALTGNLLQNEVEAQLPIELLSETLVASRKSLTVDTNEDITDYIKSSLRVASAITAVNTATKGVMTDVLEKYNDVFCLDLDGDYATLSKVEVNKALVKKNFTSISQVKKAFDNSVLDIIMQNTPSVTPQQPSQSGGGGGSRPAGGSKPVGFSGAPSQTTVPSTNNCSFKDIESISWAKDAISKLYAKGIVSGYSQDEFKPHGEVTRAEFTKLVVSLTDNNKAIEGVNFTDVSDSDWFAPFVKKAVSVGVVNGSGDLFMPNNSITREDAAVIIYRFLSGRVSFSGKTEFNDKGDMSSYATDAIESLSGAGIVNGMGDGYFMPKNTLTRAQAAVLINSVLSILEQGGAI